MPAARRWRRPQVRPLSIWDLSIDGGQLWQRLGAPRVAALRERGRREAEIGAELAATTVGAVLRLRERHGFDGVFVGGGLTTIAAFSEELLDRAEIPIQVSPDGRFAGERGGLELLRELDDGDAAVVDVGQTAIKASCRGHRLVRERDRGALPLELIDPKGTPPRRSATRLETATAFIGDAIAEVAAAGGMRDGCLALALPCPLDDTCVPGPCTYGWEGEAGLVPAILERAGRRFRDVLVLNDAELVAETALSLRPAGARARVLVLSLGFGPGGALIG